MLTLLNKTFLIEIQMMRCTRSERNFEHLAERGNDLRKSNHSVSSQNRFELLMSDHIDEFACDFRIDFRIDFVAYLLCVLCIDSSIDSNRVDQNRIDFDLNNSRFEHLNNDSDANQF